MGISIFICLFLFLAGMPLSIALWISAWLLLPKWKHDRRTTQASIGWKDYASSVLVWVAGLVLLFAFLVPISSWLSAFVISFFLLTPALLFVVISLVEKWHHPATLQVFVILAIGLSLAYVILIRVLSDSGHAAFLETEWGLVGTSIVLPAFASQAMLASLLLRVRSMFRQRRR